MIHRAIEDLDVDLTRSAMVGDKISDMQAALAVGIPYRYQVIDGESYEGCISVGNLAEACKKLLAAV